MFEKPRYLVHFPYICCEPKIRAFCSCRCNFPWIEFMVEALDRKCVHTFVWKIFGKNRSYTHTSHNNEKAWFTASPTFFNSLCFHCTNFLKLRTRWFYLHLRVSGMTLACIWSILGKIRHLFHSKILLPCLLLISSPFDLSIPLITIPFLQCL